MALARPSNQVESTHRDRPDWHRLSPMGSGATHDDLAEIEAATARVHEGERADARRAALAKQIAEDQKALNRLQQAIDASEHRVEDLQGHSLAHVVAALRRSRGHEIDAASAEVRAAQLELATRESALAKVRAECEAARVRALQLGADRRALEEARRRREAAITSSGTPAGENIQSLSERRSALARESAATKDALAAATDALGAVSECSEWFAKAGSWANADIFFHRGSVVDLMQNDRLDDAAQAASAVQAALHRLSADVEGLDVSLDLPEISQRLRTFDLWTGGFFTELTIRDGIRTSQKSVSATQREVEEIASDLRTRSASIDAELAKVNAEYEALLASSPGP